jgi:hypothetical protein
VEVLSQESELKQMMQETVPGKKTESIEEMNQDYFLSRKLF